MTRGSLDLEALRTAAIDAVDAGGVPHRSVVALAAAVPKGAVVTVLPADGKVRVPVVVVEHHGAIIPDRLAGLTAREREVAALIAEGCTNRTIGKRLSISEATVKDHVHRILEKSGAPNRTTVAGWWRASSST